MGIEVYLMKTIANLWNGNIAPVRYSGINNSEMRKMRSLIQSSFEKLEECVEDKALLRKYNDSMNEYVIMAAEQAFSDGFCLGTKITAEAMTKAEEII